ncbi:hypothetical protein [Jiella marina]|uniref:hypothetical protein n=1 Tax=Jiella sp. LLJ827 TaxID=2917712 RepID=UPI002100E9A0|nr:hypothetical protein [Jiella sp. LLJ827]MCQ0987082.1 hypothetical protein [Jiella sp. LLJ827]
MFKKTLITFATLTVAAMATASGAAASHYGSGTMFLGDYKFAGQKKHCRWMRKKIVIGRDLYGQPIYEWKRYKVCD